ncbi:MAG: hypothetical protein KQI62_02295 [Deltaproteobacteria bacterium]|nr:hypothetical protein [Deltaproteobacteria bacterium]
MKRFAAIIAIFALALCLAAPAIATQQIIIQGNLNPTLLEDGTPGVQMVLSGGLGLPKESQHPPTMVQVGELDGYGIWAWLDTDARAAGLQGETGYLGASWDELSTDVYKAVMEIEHQTTDGEGNPTTEHLKLVDADAAGISYTPADVHPPHNWQGWQ